MTEAGFPHKGRLQFIDNAVDGKSGTITAAAVFDNADGALHAGPVRPRPPGQRRGRRPWPWSPEQALGIDLGKRFVLVLSRQQGGVPPGRPWAARWADCAIVTAGLKPGDKIVVDRPAEGAARATP